MQRILQRKVLAVHSEEAADVKARIEQVRKLPPAAAQRLQAAANRGKLPEMRVPAWQKQAAHLVKDVARLGLDVLNGRPILRPPGERQAALAVCEGCEWWIAQSGRCGQCGCVMAVKVQALSWTCPLGRWPVTL